MINFPLKFLLFLTVIAGTVGNQMALANDSLPDVDALSTIAEEDRGLVTISSAYDVTETANRLENIIQEKGLTLFTRIDHSANAQKVGGELPPTQLLIFGNPKVGTPLMNCSATTAIDLPQKILVVQDEERQTKIIYNAPEYLRQRHDLQDCDEVLTKVAGVLKGITEAAAE